VCVNDILLTFLVVYIILLLTVFNIIYLVYILMLANGWTYYAVCVEHGSPVFLWQRVTSLWWAGLRATLLKIISDTPNCINCVNFMIYKQLTNVAAVCRLKTHGVEHHGGHSFCCFCTIQKTVATVPVCPYSIDCKFCLWCLQYFGKWKCFTF